MSGQKIKVVAQNSSVLLIRLGRKRDTDQYAPVIGLGLSREASNSITGKLKQRRGL